MLGQIALHMGLINEEQLAQALAEQMGLQVINLNDVVIPPEVLAHVTEPMAQLYKIVPVSFRDGTLTSPCASRRKSRCSTSCGASWATTSGPWSPPSATSSRRSTATTRARGRASRQLIADIESDEELSHAGPCA